MEEILVKKDCKNCSMLKCDSRNDKAVDETCPYIVKTNLSEIEICVDTTLHFKEGKFYVKQFDTRDGCIIDSHWSDVTEQIVNAVLNNKKEDNH